MCSSRKNGTGYSHCAAAYDILVIDEFTKNERRIVPAVVSKNLSTGIWDGPEILREYLNGRISAQLLSSIIRTDILRRNGGFSIHPYAGDLATWISVLLEGRSGLVNERCATYFAHGSSRSSSLSADIRFIDVFEVMEEISAIAEHKIPDRTKRLRIQKLTSRYVAYQAMINLVLYRRAGASLSDVVQKLWDWRPMLKHCTLRDFVTISKVRSLGRILLPTPVIQWSIALKLDKVF